MEKKHRALCETRSTRIFANVQTVEESDFSLKLNLFSEWIGRTIKMVFKHSRNCFNSNDSKKGERERKKPTVYQYTAPTTTIYHNKTCNRMRQCVCVYMFQSVFVCVHVRDERFCCQITWNTKHKICVIEFGRFYRWLILFVKNERKKNLH